MVGAPGSGKSTWAEKFEQEHPDVILLCPDKARAMFGTGESDQSVSAVAFDYVRRQAEKMLGAGANVIIDATGMYRKARKQWIDIANKFGVKKIAAVFERDKNLLMQRNQERGAKGGRNVPEHVIDNMLSRYERPDTLEFDEIEFL